MLPELRDGLLVFLVIFRESLGIGPSTLASYATPIIHFFDLFSEIEEMCRFLLLHFLAAAACASATHASVAGAAAGHDGSAGGAGGGVAHVVHGLHGVGDVVCASIFDRG